MRIQRQFYKKKMGRAQPLSKPHHNWVGGHTSPDPTPSAPSTPRSSAPSASRILRPQILNPVSAPANAAVMDMVAVLAMAAVSSVVATVAIAAVVAVVAVITEADYMPADNSGGYQ